MSELPNVICMYIIFIIHFSNILDKQKLHVIVLLMNIIRKPHRKKETVQIIVVLKKQKIFFPANTLGWYKLKLL